MYVVGKIAEAVVSVPCMCRLMCGATTGLLAELKAELRILYKLASPTVVCRAISLLIKPTTACATINLRMSLMSSVT